MFSYRAVFGGCCACTKRLIITCFRWWHGNWRLRQCCTSFDWLDWLALQLWCLVLAGKQCSPTQMCVLSKIYLYVPHPAYMHEDMVNCSCTLAGSLMMAFCIMVSWPFSETLVTMGCMMSLVCNVVPQIALTFPIADQSQLAHCHSVVSEWMYIQSAASDIVRQSWTCVREYCTKTQTYWNIWNVIHINKMMWQKTICCRQMDRVFHLSYFVSRCNAAE